MNTPSVFLLNVRTSDWLKAERDRWTLKASGLVGQDRADALAYVDQVKAELAQRAANAGKNWFVRVAGNLLETVGGSGGAGASGAVGGAIDTVSKAASGAADSVGGFLKSSRVYVLVAVIVLGGLFIYLKFGRK